MALTAATAVAAEIDPDMRVVVRTYNAGQLAAGDVEAAIAGVVAILNHAGLELAWRDCENVFVRTPTHPCAAPLGTNELAVRMVRTATNADYRGELPLGYSLVNTATRSGALATIYVDRVAWLAGAAGANRRVLLGRAIAHELGHLLLGSNRHSDAGLMRAIWSCENLQRNADDDWLFAPSDTQAMRQAIHLRAVSRLARVRVGD